MGVGGLKVKSVDCVSVFVYVYTGPWSRLIESDLLVASDNVVCTATG